MIVEDQKTTAPPEPIDVGQGVRVIIIGGNSHVSAKVIAAAKMILESQPKMMVQVYDESVSRLQESEHFKNAVRRLQVSAELTSQRFRDMSTGLLMMPQISGVDLKDPNPLHHNPPSRGKGKKKQQWSK